MLSKAYKARILLLQPLHLRVRRGLGRFMALLHHLDLRLPAPKRSAEAPCLPFLSLLRLRLEIIEEPQLGLSFQAEAQVKRRRHPLWGCLLLAFIYLLLL